GSAAGAPIEPGYWTMRRLISDPSGTRLEAMIAILRRRRPAFHAAGMRGGRRVALRLEFRGLAGLREGQLDRDGGAGAAIPGRDPPPVQHDGPPGDGQAEPDAAAGPAPVPLDAVEGLEDGLQPLARDARPAVADDQRGQPVATPQFD